MKKSSFVLLLSVSILLMATGTAFPADSEPKVYVNEWPAFSVSYPSGWIENTPFMPRFFFRADDPQGFSSVRAMITPSKVMPLKSSTKIYIPEMRKYDKNTKLIYEKEVMLKDNTAAYEFQVEWTFDGIKQKSLFLTAQKESQWITIIVSNTQGKISEDLKQIAYSLKIQKGEDKLASVPADILKFLDQYSNDLTSYNIDKIKDYYSDQFLNNGINREFIGAYVTMIIGPKSYQINITKFESQGKQAHIAGFVATPNDKYPLLDFNSYLIKENGKWKFYGNQKQRM
jgi:hypothetical protein